MSVERSQVSLGEARGARSYYGRPVLKEPVWSWEIPWYFFAGGLAGASSTLALVAGLSGNGKLARRARFIAVAGAAASPPLLISDLGRPDRFYNMLRVFKPTSPMSVGTWVLSVFGVATSAAAASDVLALSPRLGRTCDMVAALFGPAVSTYTAVLLADTSIPVWHEARRELPFVFAASSVASAGAAATVLTPPEYAGPARRMAVGAVFAQLGSTEYMKRRLGDFLAEPYEDGEPAFYGRLARLCSGVGAAVIGLGGRRRRWAAVTGGTIILAGAVLERWSVFKAGFRSVRDPKYAVEPQRERLRERQASEDGFA